MVEIKPTPEQELSLWEEYFRIFKVKTEEDEKEYFSIKEKIEQLKDQIAKERLETKGYVVFSKADALALP